MTLLRVRQFRKQAGLTLRELSEACRVTPAHLSRVERGLAIPSDALEFRIAHTLGLSDDERALMLGCGPLLRAEPRTGITLVPSVHSD